MGHGISVGGFVLQEPAGPEATPEGVWANFLSIYSAPPSFRIHTAVSAAFPP